MGAEVVLMGWRVLRRRQERRGRADARPSRHAGGRRHRWRSGDKGSRRDWLTGRGIIVREDVQHSFNGQGAVGAMLFVEPESAEGQWLRSSLPSDITRVTETR